MPDNETPAGGHAEGAVLHSGAAREAATVPSAGSPSAHTPAAETADILASELSRHALARPEGEPVTWCVCLCWSVTRASLTSDERAYERHVARAQALRLSSAPGQGA